jgi:hypothetical protein
MAYARVIYGMPVKPSATAIYRTGSPARLPANIYAVYAPGLMGNQIRQPYLDRAEDPQNQRLKNDQEGGSNTKGKVYAKELGHVRVSTNSFIDLDSGIQSVLQSKPAWQFTHLCPVFQPHRSPCQKCISVPISNEGMRESRSGSLPPTTELLRTNRSIA